MHPRQIADDEQFASQAAEVLKAIAHPVRLRIVDVLASEPTHVGALAARLHVKQPIVSQQLRILRAQGLVQSRRANGLVVNELAEPELRQLLACMGNCVCGRER
jgi:DNA-binding transcriptional ArsR family regulator